MEGLQSSTSDKNISDALVKNPTDPRYEALIDYKALNGLITADDGTISKMSMQAFADGVGVSRDTLYDWIKRDGFWDAVNERRKTISTKSRLAGVHETWYLRARKGDFQHLQLWLANFDPNFRMPTEKVEHELGNSWASLVRSHKPQNQIIEAEIVNGDTTEN